MLHGSQPERVIELIRMRAEARRRGERSADGRKLALVIEGGGMRSVCSAAGAAALCQLGLHDIFDEVYATSAGAMNAVYLLTNQPELGMSVYFDDCTTWRFLNPFRFWKILNVDYIVDHVTMVRKPFDLAALRASLSHLLIAACDRRTGKLVLIDTRTTNTPIHQVLKAAMAIPVLYNRTIQVDDLGYIDAGTILPYPLTEALERGCTDLLVLQTRHSEFTESPPSRMRRYVFNSLHALRLGDLQLAYSGRHVTAGQVRDLALGRIRPPDGVNIAAICPEGIGTPDVGTTDPATTFRAALEYGRRTFEYFGRSADEFKLSLA
jgi:predicted patatin/cPLA2 family phospholipase